MSESVFDQLPLTGENAGVVLGFLRRCCEGSQDEEDPPEDLSEEDGAAVEEVAAQVQHVELLVVYRMALSGDEQYTFRLFLDRESPHALLWHDDEEVSEGFSYESLAEVTPDTLLAALCRIMVETEGWRVPQFCGDVTVFNRAPEHLPREHVERLINAIFDADRSLITQGDPQTAAEFMREGYEEGR